MRAPIRKADTRPSHQILDRIGREDLAGLSDLRDQNAYEYRDASKGTVVILDLTSMYADLHRNPESLHGISDRTPTADSGGGTIEDGEDFVPDHSHLLPTVAS